MNYDEYLRRVLAGSPRSRPSLFGNPSNPRPGAPGS